MKSKRITTRVGVGTDIEIKYSPNKSVTFCVATVHGTTRIDILAISQTDLYKIGAVFTRMAERIDSNESTR